jgi:hypothetical protein
MEFTKFEVGQPFPLPVPLKEGAFLELWGDGLVLIIQFPRLTDGELRAFERGFARYSYWESQTAVPVAVFVFDFPRPFNLLDVNFNARAVEQKHPEWMENYLDLEEGQVKNAMSIYLLDGQILKGAKYVGLMPRSVRLFQATIRKQIEKEYTQYEYDRSLREIHQYSSEKLLKMGTIFRMRRKS